MATPAVYRRGRAGSGGDRAVQQAAGCDQQRNILGDHVLEAVAVWQEGQNRKGRKMWEKPISRKTCVVGSGPTGMVKEMNMKSK